MATRRPLVVSDGVVRELASGDTIPNDARPNGLTQPLLVDDFFVTTNESGEIGELGWYAVSSPTVSRAPSTASNPGIVTVATTAVAGDLAGIGLSTGEEHVLLAQLVSCVFVVSPRDTTNVQYRVGFMSSPSTAGTGGGDRHYFEYDSAVNANWHAISRTSGTEVDTDTGVAVTANNSYQFEFFCQSGGAQEFFINGVSKAVHSTNIPTAPIGPALVVENGPAEAVIKTMWIDYFSLRLKTITQRWT